MSEFTTSMGRYFPHAFTLRLPISTANGMLAADAHGQGGDSRGLDFVGICTPEGLSRNGTEAAPRLRITLTSCMSGIFEKHLDIDGLASLRADAGMREFSWDVFLRLLSDALQCKNGCSTTANLTRRTSEHFQGDPEMAGPQVEVAQTRLTFRFQLEAATLVSQLDIPQRSMRAVFNSSTEAYLLELRHFLLDALAAARAEGRCDAGSSTSASTGARAVTMLEDRGRRTNSGNLIAKTGVDKISDIRNSAVGLEAAATEFVSRAPAKANGSCHSNAPAGSSKEKVGLRQGAESSCFVPGSGTGSEVTAMKSEVASKTSFAALMESVQFHVDQALPATGSARLASLHARGDSIFASASHHGQPGAADKTEAKPSEAPTDSNRNISLQRFSDNLTLGHAAGLAGSALSSRSLPASGATSPASSTASAGTSTGVAKRAAVPPKKRCGGSLVDPRARKVQKGTAFRLHGA
mmetsp:Transcript_94344/g.177555  ORF Transcript_94344/g.177555 Transcript_94344/m.177555 type:complete len:466 (-) Transcript_94344:48-1445(-)